MKKNNSKKKDNSKLWNLYYDHCKPYSDKPQGHVDFVKRAVDRGAKTFKQFEEFMAELPVENAKLALEAAKEDSSYQVLNEEGLVEEIKNIILTNDDYEHFRYEEFDSLDGVEFIVTNENLFYEKGFLKNASKE